MKPMARQSMKMTSAMWQWQSIQWRSYQPLYLAASMQSISGNNANLISGG
jgi:hypothetical protein